MHFIPSFQGPRKDFVNRKKVWSKKHLSKINLASNKAALHRIWIGRVPESLLIQFPLRMEGRESKGQAAAVIRVWGDKELNYNGRSLKKREGKWILKFKQFCTKILDNFNQKIWTLSTNILVFHRETSLANYADSLEQDVYLSASFNKTHGAW